MTRRSVRPEEIGRRVFVAGDAYGFHHLPLTKFASPERPRYGAVRVLVAAADLTTVVVLDGTFGAPPTLADALALAPLKMELRPMNAPGGWAHGRIAIVHISTKWPPEDELELSWLGTAPVGSRELAWIHSLASYAGGWSIVSRYAEREWRWRHDRERLREEGERVQAAAREEAVATAKKDLARQNERQNNLTWDGLLAEKHFARWSESPPFPAPPFPDAARATIDRTIRAICSLGPKPKKAEVRAALRECVDWFNVEAERAGDVIETQEREDIVLLLADICFVARQRSLVDEIDQWRTW